MRTRIGVLAAAIGLGLLSAAGTAFASDKPKGLWDGAEPVEAYAKRTGLEPSLELDLGGGVKMELALIPPGVFMMGSPEAEKGRFENETQHRVFITNPFYMGKYAVTQEQYEAVMGGNPSRRCKGAQNPVEMILWDDSQSFCRKLAKKCGQPVRLPTEAEWEYACRAGSTTIYHSGNSEKDLKRAAWFDANSGYTTHPVGQKDPNKFGLHDMHGNVWQWCQDGFGDYISRQAIDPQGPVDSHSHVLRGGACGQSSENCRSASRASRGAAGGAADAGIRIVAPLKRGAYTASVSIPENEAKKEKMNELKKEAGHFIEENATRLAKFVGEVIQAADQLQ